MKHRIIGWWHKRFTVTCVACGTRYNKWSTTRHLYGVPSRPSRAYTCFANKHKGKQCSDIVHEQLESRVREVDVKFWAEAISAPRVMESLLQKWEHEQMIRDLTRRY